MALAYDIVTDKKQAIARQTFQKHCLLRKEKDYAGIRK
jgi:hypothetical protein